MPSPRWECYCIASPAAPSAIIPTYVNVGDPERAVVEAAISRWEDLLPGSRVFNVTIQTSYLGGTLAFASEFAEENGVPIGASITFDDGSSGIPWFIDETPFDDLEFRGGRNPFHGDAGGSGPAAGAVDLLTVMQHELGHALGSRSSIHRSRLVSSMPRRQPNLHRVNGHGAPDGSRWRYPYLAGRTPVRSDEPGAHAGAQAEPESAGFGVAPRRVRL